MGEDVDDVLAPHPSVIAKLNNDNFFAILERAEGFCTQVGYGAQADAKPGGYALEYREGSADRHFRVETTDVEATQRFMTEFLANDDAWKRRPAWNRVSL